MACVRKTPMERWTKEPKRVKLFAPVWQRHVEQQQELVNFKKNLNNQSLWQQ